MARYSGTKVATGSLLGTDIVRVLVGPDQREFAIHKKLLCAAGPFFRNSLEAVPAALAATPGLPAANRSGAASPVTAVLWLSSESPNMFELFVLWLYQRRAFSTLIDETINALTRESPPSPKVEASQTALHWNLVRLHLFAASVDLPALQDVAMDALQDLYLRCDWDVSARFVRYLYTRDPEHAFRLRKWAVAMVAWTLAANGHDEEDPVPQSFQRLFNVYADLRDDYVAHMDKMVGSRANVAIKNPQLRLPANRLRSEERHFGFRQCSFHSHRSAVGEGRCPLLNSASTPPLPDKRRAVRSDSDSSDSIEIAVAARMQVRGKPSMRFRSASDPQTMI